MFILFCREGILRDGSLKRQAMVGVLERDVVSAQRIIDGEKPDQHKNHLNIARIFGTFY